VDNKRNIHLDALKGLAIILVVTGHIIAFSHPGTVDKSLLFNVIYSFHMPLFFFISGYLVFGRFGPTTSGWIQKKFGQLIIPYTIFTIFYFFILFSPSLSAVTPVRVFQVFFSFTVPDSAWFLPVLFESFIILSLCIAVEKFLGKFSYITFFILVSCILPLTSLTTISAVHQIVFYTPFVVIGYLASEYKDKISCNVPVIEISGSFLFLLLFVLKFWKLLPANFFNLYYSYVVALAGIILSWLVVEKIIHMKISHIFVFCGILSMEIYLTHLVILNYFTFRQWPLWFGTGLTAIISGTIVLLTISVILSLILSYNKKISSLIFGRWSWQYLFSHEKEKLRGT